MMACDFMAVIDCPQVQAAFDYVVQQPNELNLERDDVVKVFWKIPDGEWPILN